MATDRPQAITSVQPTAVTLAATDVVQKVVEITRQIFPGSVSIEPSHDPEYPQDEFIVLTVEPSGEIDELLERECQWIQRVADIMPGLGAFRLAIHPK